MSGFSPEWLALREPVDHRSRSSDIAQALAARFQKRQKITVVDLGCGTGSNLRATMSLLPSEQQWTLVDFDEQLLAVAKRTLMDWADRAEADADGLLLDKDGKRIAVQFQRADLNRDLDSALGLKPDLVTAAALFDLCSPAFIKAFARAVAARRAVFCTVLTYNGIQRWTPRQPSDGAMIAAFHAHQMTDKGFRVISRPDRAGTPRRRLSPVRLFGLGRREPVGAERWQHRLSPQPRLGLRRCSCRNRQGRYQDDRRVAPGRAHGRGRRPHGHAGHARLSSAAQARQHARQHIVLAYQVVKHGGAEMHCDHGH